MIRVSSYVDDVLYVLSILAFVVILLFFSLNLLVSRMYIDVSLKAFLVLNYTQRLLCRLIRCMEL